jgi:hypothetical protein
MVTQPLRCPVCDIPFDADDYASLAEHFATLASQSDDNHVMWLNRRVTKERTETATLADLLRGVLTTGEPPPARHRVER